MEIIENYKKQTLKDSLKSLPIDPGQCLKVDVLKKYSALTTIDRLRPEYKFTTKTVGSDFFIWRVK